MVLPTTVRNSSNTINGENGDGDSEHIIIRILLELATTKLFESLKFQFNAALAAKRGTAPKANDLLHDRYQQERQTPSSGFSPKVMLMGTVYATKLDVCHMCVSRCSHLSSRINLITNNESPIGEVSKETLQCINTCSLRFYYRRSNVYVEDCYFSPRPIKAQK